MGCCCSRCIDANALVNAGTSKAEVEIEQIKLVNIGRTAKASRGMKSKNC